MMVLVSIEIAPNQNILQIILDHPLMNPFNNQRNLGRKKMEKRNQKQQNRKSNTSKKKKTKVMMKEKCFYSSLIYQIKSKNEVVDRTA